MYVFFECLTVLALVMLVATLLFAVCVVLVALEQGITILWRTARKAAKPAVAQEMLGSS
jgi:hypothetical protein